MVLAMNGQIDTNKDNTELEKFAVETMVEVAKQLVTLSSGFIVVSVTLLKFIVPDVEHETVTIEYWPIVITWILLILSIGTGLLALGAVARTAHDDKKYDVDDSNTKLFLQMQQVFFAAAFAFFVYFSSANFPT
jgi:hypothetical protein